MATERTGRRAPYSTDEFARDATAPFQDFGIHPVDADSFAPGTEVPISKLRRARRRLSDEDRVSYMSLVETDGVLRWQLGLGPAPSRQYGPRRRARGGAAGAAAGAVIRQFKFEDLPPNAIGKRLQELDRHLTPVQGLRAVVADSKTGAKVGAEATPVAKGRILLIVHGTFSNGANVLEEIASTPAGRDMLGRALTGTRYQQVLAFNHPTLSLSPILNAAALAQLFRASSASVDVICHSRGGLVVRWWFEVLDHCDTPRGRVVFAGPPLAGTGLAAPARLRAALNLLTNMSRTLGAIAKTSGMVFPAAAPIGQAAGILFGLFGKLTSLAAKMPIVDAGVALIPGLAGQSREGANAEIIRLRESFAGLDDAVRRRRYLANYYFVTSNFEPEDPRWKFWQYFRKDRLLDMAADLVFEGENDLVVDTSSMASLADRIGVDALESSCIENFGGTSTEVHHLNYFQQAATIRLISNALQLA